MEQNYLNHHGIKGQRWGVRRFQNKDGSLTKAGKKRRDAAESEEEKKKQEQETVEQRRARLLKSSDAKELYENRHLLSTNEINERLVRIDTEKKLGVEAARYEKENNKINKMVSKVKAAADIAEAAYQITQMPVVKAIWNKMKGGEPDSTDFDMDNAIKNIDKMSNKEVQALSERLGKTLAAKNIAKKLKDMDAEEAAKVAAAKQAKKDAKASKKQSKKDFDETDEDTTKTEKHTTQKTSKTDFKYDYYDPKTDTYYYDADFKPTSSAVPNIGNNRLPASPSHPSISAGRSVIAGFLNPPKDEDD